MSQGHSAWHSFKVSKALFLAFAVQSWFRQERRWSTCRFLSRTAGHRTGSMWTRTRLVYPTCPSSAASLWQTKQWMGVWSRHFWLLAWHATGLHHLFWCWTRCLAPKISDFRRSTADPWHLLHSHASLPPESLSTPIWQSRWRAHWDYHHSEHKPQVSVFKTLGSPGFGGYRRRLLNGIPHRFLSVQHAWFPGLSCERSIWAGLWGGWVIINFISVMLHVCTCCAAQCRTFSSCKGTIPQTTGAHVSCWRIWGTHA